jgi:ABC-type multidrug transport system fused ATPase/permease subunit
MLRRGGALLWESARTHPRPFATAVAGSALYAVMAVGGTVAVGRLTDDVVIPAFDHPDEGVPGGTIAIASGAIVGVALLRMVGVVLRRYFGHMNTWRMQRTWFLRVVHTYLSVPLSFFGRHPTGELLAHADADIERAVNVLHPLPFACGLVVLIATSVASLAAVDPVLMLAALALFPALALLNRIYTRRIEEPAMLTQERIGDVSTVAHESFEGALVVKTLGLEAREEERLGESAEALRAARLDVGRLRATFEPGLDALPSLGTIALLAVGSWRISQGALTIGGMVQAMALFGILAFPTRVMGFLLEELPRAVVAADRLRGLMATPPRALPAEGAGTRLPAGSLGIAIDDVAFSYPVPLAVADGTHPNGETGAAGDDGAKAADTTVLDGCSFTVEPGEVVALVGATGSGKSTLCELLAHLYDPDLGTVRIGGVDLADADPVSVRRSVALAFQEAFLFVAPIRDNLTLGEEVDGTDLTWALEMARADRFVAHLPGGLDHVVGERGVTLSGGQRQRLALARALLRRPGLLLLDDATSAVDPVIELQILANLRRSLSTTTLVVAHRLSTIALADRVLFLQDGRIAASGPHTELVATVPAYAALAHAYEEEEAA